MVTASESILLGLCHPTRQSYQTNDASDYHHEQARVAMGYLSTPGHQDRTRKYYDG